MGDTEKRQWKLGEECYIAHYSLTPGYVHMEVMPAIIVNAQVPFAQSCKPFHTLGPFYEQGQPFSTIEAAREWLQNYVKEIVIASKAIPLTGSRPCWKKPEGWPSHGDVVYCIDADTKEVIEATVGFLSIEHGLPRIGYDSSPGNPEALNIKLSEWWREKDVALGIARERHGPDITFVTKEELAMRTDEEINDLWRRVSQAVPTSFSDLAPTFQP